MLNLFLKDLFESFSVFSVLLQIIHRMSNINNFQLFLILGSLIKTLPQCNQISVLKLFLLINFYILGMLLHYPLFLLPLDEFIVNNKQALETCITSSWCDQVFQFFYAPSFWANFIKMLQYDPFPAIHLK